MEGEVFVGRQRELAVLEGRRSRASAGEGGVVLVDGEPGMGKTALGHELARRARRAGMVTRWGGCWEGEGAPAYRPWLQVLAGVTGNRLLSPEGDTRFRLFDEVVELLRTAAAARGMLVVLDDLHWADVPSMRLLQALAAEIADCPLLVVGLYRPAEVYPRVELSRVLHAVLRMRGTSRMSLGRLAPGEVEQLAVAAADHRPSDALLRAVKRRAEGNPLFVVELVRFAATAGAASRSLPTGVRQVIAQRLDRLPQDTRDLLRHASVLGREFSATLLAQTAGLPPDRIDDHLDAAVAADLVVTGDGHTLRFAHVLTQEVAYGELPAAERQRLHLRAARSIEAGQGADSDMQVDSLAHHLRQAATLAGAQPALQATLRAARHANDQAAYEHAAFQYRQALNLLPLLSRTPVTRQGLLVELARCQFRSGAVADTWASCHAAADLARASGDAATVAEAALVIRGLTNDPVCDQIHALCREGLALLRGEDAVLHARLLGQLAVTANPWAGGPEPGLSERALVAAEATGDPDARFLALQARHADLIDFECSSERLSIGERAVQLGRETGREDYTAWGHVWRLDAFWQLSQRLRLDAELVAYTGLVNHLREPLSMWRLTMIQASLALLEGRFTEASALADRALTIGRTGGHEEADFMHLVFRGHLAPQVGDSDGMAKIEATVRRLARNGPFMAHNWHAKVLADMGRIDEAAVAFASVVPHAHSFPRHTVEWIIATTANADLCILLDRPAMAPGLYADLLPFADRQAVGRAQSPSLGPVALYLGKLARIQQDWAVAEAHLHTALHLAAAMGSPPFEVLTRVEIARVLLARRGPADVRDAQAELETAVHTASRIGMAPLAAQANSLLTASRGGRAGPLSAREEQVAGLVAEGLSNRLIATRLRLSERTVETHVRSIFNKLGFESRTRIATWYTSLPKKD